MPERCGKFGGFIAAAVLLFAAVCPPAPAAELAEALPPDTLIFIDIPGVPALRAGGGESAYAKIMSEEAVRKFIEQGFPALASLREDFQGVVGRSFGELLEMLTGEAAFALVPDENTVVGAVIAAQVGPDMAGFREFLADIEGRLPGEWETVEIPGTTARVLAEETFSISYALVGRTLVMCSSPGLLKSVAASLFSGKSDSLAASAKFTTALAAAGVQQPELLVYLDAPSLLGLLLRKAPEELARAFSLLGISDIGSVLYWSRPAGRGFLDTLFVHFPKGRTGAFACVEGAADEYKRVFSMVPPSALGASWGYGDFGVLYDGVAAAIEAAVPPETLEDFKTAAEEAQLKMGFRVRDDLIAGLGKNLLAYNIMPSQVLGMGFSGGFGQSVTMIELADRERFEKALASGWAYIKGRWDGAELKMDGPPPFSAPVRLTFLEHEFEKKTVYEVRVALQPMLQVAPAMAVSDGWLVLAMDTQSVKNALSPAARGPEDLFDNKDYTTSAAFAGLANASASYSNSKAMFETVYSTLSIMMPFVLAQLGGETPVDQWLLPPTQVISKHLFGTAGAGTVSDESFKLTRYGPIGMVRSGYLLAAGGGALGYWQAKSGGQVRPPWGPPRTGPTEAGANDLKMIGLGLLIYSNDHSGAFPGDLATLKTTGYLGEGYEIRIDDYRYVTGLRDDDDPRLIVVFARESTPEGRLALYVDGHVMSLSASEVAEQAGAWLDLAETPTQAEREAACEKNLRALFASVMKYAEFHGGKVPEKLDRSVDYRFAPLVVSCPVDSSLEGSDYSTVAGLDINSVSEQAKGKALAVYEHAPRHQGRHGAVFLDGTFRRLTGDELNEAVALTRTFSSPAGAE